MLCPAYRLSRTLFSLSLQQGMTITRFLPLFEFFFWSTTIQRPRDVVQLVKFRAQRGCNLYWRMLQKKSFVNYPHHGNNYLPHMSACLPALGNGKLPTDLIQEGKVAYMTWNYLWMMYKYKSY